MKFVYDDGGRAAAGYKGASADCVTRSIAIATGRPYRKIYDEINALAKTERVKRGKSSARTGVRKATIRRYLTGLGWNWTPTMRIGQGCTVHLADDELPAGQLIVSVSKHLTAVIDGIIHDTHDPQRWTLKVENGTARNYPSRCVYGYWSKPTV